MNSGKSRYLSGCRGIKVEISFYFLWTLFFVAFKICNQNIFGNKCSIAYIIKMYVRDCTFICDPPNYINVEQIKCEIYAHMFRSSRCGMEIANFQVKWNFH